MSLRKLPPKKKLKININLIMNSTDNFEYIYSIFMWRNISKTLKNFRLSFTLLTDKEETFKIDPMQEINRTLFKKIEIRKIQMKDFNNYVKSRLNESKYHGLIISKSSQVLTSSVVWRCLSMCFYFKSPVLTLPIGHILNENSRAGIFCASIVDLVHSLPLKLYSFNDLDLL